MYINKDLVAVGPCKASSEVKYYDELDITKYLKEGKNVFEVAVLQLANEPFSKNYMFMESVQRGGDMCLAIWGNIGEQEISTDEDWLVAKELGMVCVEWVIVGDIFTINVDVPNYTEALLLMPNASSINVKSGKYS